MVTEKELNEAKVREASAQTTEPRALDASCDGTRVEVVLGGSCVEGVRVDFPVNALPFLAHGTTEQLNRVVCVPGGEALEWPELNEVVVVRGLLEQLTGLRSLTAMRQRGGAARTSAKVAAARSNGAKGGRPRKAPAPA